MHFGPDVSPYSQDDANPLAVAVSTLSAFPSVLLRFEHNRAGTLPAVIRANGSTFHRRGEQIRRNVAQLSDSTSPEARLGSC